MNTYLFFFLPPINTSFFSLLGEFHDKRKLIACTKGTMSTAIEHKEGRGRMFGMDGFGYPVVVDVRVFVLSLRLYDTKVSSKQACNENRGTALYGGSLFRHVRNDVD